MYKERNNFPGIRKPVMAGMFYEEGFQKLNEEIEDCFLSERGPGSLPVSRDPRKTLKGIISPHAGYAYSGMCASWAYKEIAESKLPDVYIICGPNHTGLGKDSVSLQDWQTPLGLVRTHTSFAQELLERTSLSPDESAHSQEHSIEVQLPFLQFASKDRAERLRIVALSLKGSEDIDNISVAINQIAKERKMDVCIIASSDFTHYGPRFGYEPFRYNIKENIYHLDTEAIEQIKTMKRNKFEEHINKTGATICGFLPISLLMAVSGDSTTKARLLQYYTSGDLTKDFSNSVSYASMVFE